MDRSMTRSGVRLRSKSTADNQGTVEDSKGSTPDRGRDILLRLLKQITEFLERKELLSSRVAASREWRKSRSRRRSESNNLFEVVIQVCEQRMRRLKRSTSGFGRDQDELGAQTPRVLVAEAIVQELLVSLMELKMKEKESLVMDEAETVEVMRKLHVHLQKDEEKVRNRVCVGAGDEQQLEELQLMLRTDFLEEVASADSPQKRQQENSAANNEASLQFAWETIDDQKKEIIRLRAENEELKLSSSSYDSRSSQRTSFLDEEPSKVIKLLRLQLSSHHDKNLDILHDHIQRLERALHSTTTSSRKSSRAWDGSRSTISSSRSADKEEMSVLSRSTVGTDFSRTQVSRRKCEECRKSSASLLALRSEVKQLRAHATSDEESLLQAEKDRAQFQRENAALSTALLTAKQKQEELRQMILDLTQEKHQLQNLSDSEQRTTDRTVQLLKEQLGVLQEQKAHQKRKFDELVGKYDSEMDAKRTLATSHADLQGMHEKLKQSTAELQSRVANLEEAAKRCSEAVKAKDAGLKDLRDQLETIEQRGRSATCELKEKQVQLDDAKCEVVNLQVQVEKLETEKRKMAGESERLLQTLDECRRKNQRLEKGFEELKQGKELLTSLQKVERGASALQLDELKQAREQMTSLKMQLSSVKTECSKLEQALTERKKSENQLREQGESMQARNEDDLKRLHQELEVSRQECKALEENITSQQTLQAKLEAMATMSKGHVERIDTLSQELTESKTAMLMWMNKYNATNEDKKTLESDIKILSDEQYSLQRQVEQLKADRDAVVLAKAMTSQENEECGRQLSSLREQQRIMEREHRAADQEKKSLKKLVQTLQARPELQQRAFREMLMSCQRGTERSLNHLSERVDITLKKLDGVEKSYQTLKTRLARSTTTRRGGGHSKALKPLPPQIVVQDGDFLSNAGAGFSLSVSQPVWLEAITPFDDGVEETEAPRRQSDAVAKLTDQLKLWQWKYFAQCLFANSSKQDALRLSKRARGAAQTIEQLRQAVGRLTWQKLASNMQTRHLLKIDRLRAAFMMRVSKQLERSQQAYHFTIWRDLVQLQSYRRKLRASAKESLRPACSPSTTTALGNCIQLLRQFCEPPRKEKYGTSKVKSTQGRGSEELMGYLTEINTKVASWKVAVDRKLVEFAERNSQLQSLQRRCSELKDLVGLNQRLIEEMERRAAGQQSIVEAAWDFATAYKALSPSARAQVFQSRDFLSASKGLVEGLDSLGMTRSVQRLSQTLSASRIKQNDRISTTKANFLSASAAPRALTPKASQTIETKIKSRERLNDSNIELLEDAVGSLKGAMHKQRSLQRELKQKEHSLTVTTKQLQRRNMQFLLLRSFLQWKCASDNKGARPKARPQPTMVK